MSLAFLAIESALKKSNPSVQTYNKYTFYTCIRYVEYNNTKHVACIKGIYKTHALNVFYVAIDSFRNHDIILLNRFNGSIYDYPPKSEV